MNEPIHISMCVDVGFALPLAVALASLDAANADNAVVVHVVHSGLTASTRERILEGAKSIRVEWYEIDPASLRGVHHSVFLSPASLYRLRLGDVLPNHVDRVIYLDADTVVVDSLADLFTAELGDAIVGAVADALAPWAAGPLGPPWRELGLDPSSPYLNSGVMVIDLARWRSAAVGEACLELLRAKRPRWGDQDAINTVLEGRWQALHRRWNHQTGDLTGLNPAWALWRAEVEDACRNPAIVHYTERDKPWNADCTHPAADLWREWLARTAWSGWQPTAVRSHPLAERVTGVVRAARGRRANRLTRLPD